MGNPDWFSGTKSDISKQEVERLRVVQTIPDNATYKMAQDYAQSSVTTLYQVPEGKRFYLANAVVTVTKQASTLINGWAALCNTDFDILYQFMDHYSGVAESTAVSFSFPLYMPWEPTWFVRLYSNSDDMLIRMSIFGYEVPI